MNHSPIKEIQINIQVDSPFANFISVALNPDNLVDPPMTFSMECTEETVRIKLNHIDNIETALATINDLFSAWLVSEEAIKKIKQNFRKEH